MKAKFVSGCVVSLAVTGWLLHVPLSTSTAAGLEVRDAAGRVRIRSLEDGQGGMALVLSDGKGADRIVLGVDGHGLAAIRLSDPSTGGGIRIEDDGEGRRTLEVATGASASVRLACSLSGIS